MKYTFIHIPCSIQKKKSLHVAISYISIHPQAICLYENDIYARNDTRGYKYLLSSLSLFSSKLQTYVA